MKGLFIPEITTEMFRNGYLESIEALMADGEIYDIEYSRWIPVSERLPKKDRKHNTLFLVTDSNGNLSISKFYLPLSNSDIDKPYWSGMIDVIAWMPLPKPYEPQERSDEE